MFNKNRLQKLAGILKEGAEDYSHNRVYHVIKHKMEQFIEENEYDLLETLQEVMEASLNKRERTDASDWGDADVLEDTGIEEKFYNFLHDGYLVNTLKGEIEPGSERDIEGNHAAAWEAYFEVLEDWLRRVSRDTFQLAMEEVRDSDELSRDPHSYYGVSRSDFY